MFDGCDGASFVNKSLFTSLFLVISFRFRRATLILDFAWSLCCCGSLTAVHKTFLLCAFRMLKRVYAGPHAFQIGNEIYKDKKNK